jgi:hypothetical protein
MICALATPRNLSRHSVSGKFGQRANIIRRQADHRRARLLVIADGLGKGMGLQRAALGKDLGKK